MPGLIVDACDVMKLCHKLLRRTCILAIWQFLHQLSCRLVIIDHNMEIATTTKAEISLTYKLQSSQFFLHYLNPRQLLTFKFHRQGLHNKPVVHVMFC